LPPRSKYSEADQQWMQPGAPTEQQAQTGQERHTDLPERGNDAGESLGRNLSAPGPGCEGQVAGVEAGVEAGAGVGAAVLDEESDDELVALDDDSVDDDVLALEVLLAEELPLLSVL